MELKNKKEEINIFYVQHKPWEKGLVTKEKELDELQKKMGVVEDSISSLKSKSSDLTAQVEALLRKLVEFIDSYKRNKLYEDGKQPEGSEFLILIQDEHTNFDFLFEDNEGEASEFAPVPNAGTLEVSLLPKPYPQFYRFQLQILRSLRTFKTCSSFIIFLLNF
ncbi:Uncharacterized protein Fot_24768 [Forsythia ovata]|uniref:Uncharacterized protein n=1 Tax=Forsythia ovata TaxID=205694 RepID=A0ABD1U746_9LAMI